MFEITDYGYAIYKSKDEFVFIIYNTIFGTVRIKFDDSKTDVFFRCKYFHTLMNVLKCISEVREEANGVIAVLDEAMSNLIKKNNEKEGSSCRI